MNDPSLEILLHVEETPQGGGNVAAGRYAVRFVPETVCVRHMRTYLIYRLAPDSRERYAALGLFTTDARRQFGVPSVLEGGSGIAVAHAATVAQLTVVALQVTDRLNGASLTCQQNVLSDPAGVMAG